MGSGDNSHSFALGSEQAVSEKAANKDCGIVFFNVQPHETIGCVAETATEEILVSGKKRDAAELVEQRDDIIVLDAEVREVAAELPMWDSPALQRRALVF